MLEDLSALVEFAHAGSIVGAADRLFRTPSAITRQGQRLEAALGAELLGRSAKPPRLNSLGSTVLEQARDLVAADGEAEIACVARRRTSRPLAHRARASPLANASGVPPSREFFNKIDRLRSL